MVGVVGVVGVAGVAGVAGVVGVAGVAGVAGVVGVVVRGCGADVELDMCVCPYIPAACNLLWRPLSLCSELHATSFSAGATVEAQLTSPRRHLWNSHHLQNLDVEHLLHVQLGNLHGPQDHGKLALRQDKEVNDLGKPARPAQQVIDHLVQEQLRNLHGQRDHGDLPQRRDRDDDDDL